MALYSFVHSSRQIIINICELAVVEIRLVCEQFPTIGSLLFLYAFTTPRIRFGSGEVLGQVDESEGGIDVFTCQILLE